MKYDYWAQYRRVHSLEWLVNDIAACVSNKQFMEKSGYVENSASFKRSAMLKAYYPEKIDMIFTQDGPKGKLVCGLSAGKSTGEKTWKNILVDSDGGFEGAKKQILEIIECFSEDQINTIINEVIRNRFFGGSLFYLEDGGFYSLYYLKENFFDLMDIENGKLMDVTPIEILGCSNNIESLIERQTSNFPPFPEFCITTKAARDAEDAEQNSAMESIERKISELRSRPNSRVLEDDLIKLETYRRRYENKKNDSETLYEFLRKTLNGIYKNEKCINIENGFISIEDSINKDFDSINGKYMRDYEYQLENYPRDAIVVAFLFAMSISIIGREDFSAEDNSYIFYKLFYVSETEKIEFQKDKNNSHVSEQDVLRSIAVDVVFAAKYSDFDLLYSMLCKLLYIQQDFFKSNNALCYLNYFWVKYFVEIKQKLKKDNIINAEFENCTKYDLLKNCYEQCCSKIPNFDKYYKMKEYLGLACAEYAVMIYNDAIDKEYKNLSKIIKTAKELGCEANVLIELEADLLVDGVRIKRIQSTDDFEKAYKKYRKLYASTQQESLIGKIIVCIKEAKSIKNEEGEFVINTIAGWDIDELLEVWETAKLKIAGDKDSIQKRLMVAYEDKARQLKEEVDERRIAQQQKLYVDIEKDEYRGQSDKVLVDELTATNDVLEGKENVNIASNVNDKTKDLNADDGIYVLFGARGKATENFLKSTVDRVNADFIVVLQNHEKMEDVLYIQRMFGTDSNVCVFDKGYRNIFEEEALELFSLDSKLQNDGRVFDDFRARKLHFLLLGENKSENLSFAMEIIQRAYEKHYVYKRYLELTRDRTEKDTKRNDVDFPKLIDIKLDTDTGISEWYLDSLMSRYDEEFYLPISYVTYEKEAVKELLTEYPLFLVDSMKTLKPKCNVVILGGNEISYELVKNILAVSVFQRPDLVDSSIKHAVKMGQYDVFENTVCSDFTLTIIDKNASVIEGKLHRDAPDFFRNRSYLHCIPRFYDLDVESYEIVDLFRKLDARMQVGRDESLSSMYGVSCDNSSRDREISEVLLNGNYFVCVLDNDEESIRMGMLIRELAYRQDDSFSHEPIISVLCKDGILDANVNEFSIGDESYSDAWFRNYRINQFGGYQRIFSYDTLYDNFVNQISRELHCGGKDGEDREEKMRQYFRSSYNRISCDTRALYIPYMFYSVLGKMMRYDYSLNYSNDSYEGFVNRKSWSMRVFRESIETYIEKYNEIMHQGDDETANSDNVIAEMMSILEHNRWLVFMVLQGYTSVPYGNGEFNENKKAYIAGWANRMTGDKKASKLNIAKVHPVMVPYAKLGEKEKIIAVSDSTATDSATVYKADGLEELLVEVARGSRIKVSSKSNRYYNREFVRKMGDVLSKIKERGVAENTNDIKEKTIHSREVEKIDTREEQEI